MRLSRFNDPNGCFQDAQDELIEEAKRESHLEGECLGPPYCTYCLDELDDLKVE